LPAAVCAKLLIRIGHGRQNLSSTDRIVVLDDFFILPERESHVKIGTYCCSSSFRALRHRGERADISAPRLYRRVPLLGYCPASRPMR
jgi:hypothetical protein